MTLTSLLDCRSGAHCRRCRSHAGGRRFRASIITHLPGLQEDYECPLGKPWNYTPMSESLPLQKPAEYDEIRAEILSRKEQSELWFTLADEVRLVEASVALHKEKSSCWKRRQYTRVLDGYRKVLRTASESPLQKVFKPSETPMQSSVPSHRSSILGEPARPDLPGGPTNLQNPPSGPLDNPRAIHENPPL